MTFLRRDKSLKYLSHDNTKSRQWTLQQAQASLNTTMANTGQHQKFHVTCYKVAFFFFF
jgi:hypothetical protein